MSARLALAVVKVVNEEALFAVVLALTIVSFFIFLTNVQPPQFVVISQYT
ncbi:MAG: hypothetical protein Q8S84_01445 [bacterium]|nr:hypothetical protein [bacterium]